MNPTDADWILKAMVIMAAADDRLDAREVKLIQKLYQEYTGRPVETNTVVLAVQTYAAKRDVLGELSIVAGSMDQQTKETIIRAAYLTALANERISTEEAEKLKKMVAALQLSENHLEAILNSIGGNDSGKSDPV